MTTLDILEEIFRKHFKQRFDRFDEETSRAEIEKWDSMAHVGLVLEIEKNFGIEFTPRELARLTSVGGIRELVDRKLSR